MSDLNNIVASLEERQKALEQEEAGESSTAVQASAPPQKKKPAEPSFK